MQARGLEWAFLGASKLIVVFDLQLEHCNKRQCVFWFLRLEH